MYGEPKSTLKRYINRKNETARESTKYLGRHVSTFSPNEKKHFVEGIIDMEERFFKVTLNDYKKLANEFAEKKSHFSPI